MSRLLAYTVDVVTLSAMFTAGAAVASFFVHMVTGRQLELSSDRDVAGVGLAIWWLAYFAVSWATVGATVGMGLFGVRVVRPDGSPVGPGRAAVRTLAFSASVALFGLGFLGVLFQSQRRALHDLVAGTAVVHLSRTAHQPVSGGTARGRR